MEFRHRQPLTPMTPLSQQLRASSDFLNAVLDSMEAAVMLLDADFRLHELNGALRRLFHVRDEDLDKRCGETIRCGNLERLGGECGSTAACGECVIRKAVLGALRQGENARAVSLVRDFHGSNGDGSGGPVVLHLQIAVSPIEIGDRRMALVVLHDVTEIEAAKRLLEEKDKRLREDLKAAAVIQSSLLPECCPEVPDLSFAWRFEPCDMVGGDYFNVVSLPEGVMGVVQVDVCGHGVSAAMLAVSLSRMLHPETGVLIDRDGAEPRAIAPDEVLRRLDDLYPFHRFETFFSAIYLQMDPASGRLTYSAGGHPPAWLLRAGSPPRQLEAKGRIVGIGSMCLDEDGRQAPAFPLASLVLEQGDKIVLATDGLTEHRRPDGEFFGEARLERMLAHGAALPLPTLIDRLYDEALAWGGGLAPADDISLLGFEYGRAACVIS